MTYHTHYIRKDALRYIHVCVLWRHSDNWNLYHTNCRNMDSHYNAWTYVFSEPPGNEMPHCTHHSDMVTPQHPPFYTCSLLFSQFPPSITDRQQSHCSDRSNLNSSCTLFTFLLPKPHNYTCSTQQYLRNFLSDIATLYDNCAIYQLKPSLLLATAFVWKSINIASIKESTRNLIGLR
jgi:hypothetical protein